MVLRKSELECKSKLPETMTNLIPEIKNMGIGVHPSNVVSLNSGPLRKSFQSIPPSLINYLCLSARTYEY